MKKFTVVSVEMLQERFSRKIVLNTDPNSPCYVYGVPRGGALALHYCIPAAKLLDVVFVTDPSLATTIVDDIIDSGETARYYMDHFPGKPFIGLIDKQEPEDADGGWFIFPWEQDPRLTTADSALKDAQSNVTRIIEFIGEDASREGLVETPARVVKSWGTLYGGYGADIASLFKTFEDGSCDEMVLLKNVEIYSTCEHHMLPFTGHAHIGYLPNGKVVGVSKLARLLEAFARRLQIQERIGQQITAALTQYLQPLGCACVIEAQHYCMTSRGVQKQHSTMVTSSLTGVFRTDPAARSEFYNLIKG